LAVLPVAFGVWIFPTCLAFRILSSSFFPQLSFSPAFPSRLHPLPPFLTILVFYISSPRGSPHVDLKTLTFSTLSSQPSVGPRFSEQCLSFWWSPRMEVLLAISIPTSDVNQFVCTVTNIFFLVLFYHFPQVPLRISRLPTSRRSDDFLFL